MRLFVVEADFSDLLLSYWVEDFFAAFYELKISACIPENSRYTYCTKRLSIDNSLTATRALICRALFYLLYRCFKSFGKA